MTFQNATGSAFRSRSPRGSSITRLFPTDKLITTKFFYQRIDNLRCGESYSKCQNVKIHPLGIPLILGIERGFPGSAGFHEPPAAFFQLLDSARSDRVVLQVVAEELLVINS